MIGIWGPLTNRDRSDDRAGIIALFGRSGRRDTIPARTCHVPLLGSTCPRWALLPLQNLLRAPLLYASAGLFLLRDPAPCAHAATSVEKAVPRAATPSPTTTIRVSFAAQVEAGRGGGMKCVLWGGV